MTLQELRAKAEAANNAIPGPWCQTTLNWRREPDAPNRYITGGHTEPEEGDDCGSCVSVAIVPGNETSGDIPRVIAEYLEAACPFNLLGILGQETYTIKPLEWKPSAYNWADLTAPTVMGLMKIAPYKNGFQVHFKGVLMRNADTIEEAKGFAWDLYKNRLGEALTRVD